jgi:hypothetical protein
MQDVRMKDIQNKIIISQETFMGYTITKGNYHSSSFWVYNFLNIFQCGLPWWHDKYPHDIWPRSTLLEACLVLP